MSARKLTEAETNYQVALKAECKKVVRCLHSYSSEERANNAANFRLGYQQRHRIGEFFYTHPDVPNVAFSTRNAAARRALESTDRTDGE